MQLKEITLTFINKENIMKFVEVHMFHLLNALNSSNYSLAQCQAIVTHEIGHALKLCHCREKTEIYNTSHQQEYKSTFPALMQPSINNDNDVIYTDALAGVGTLNLTEFDKSALIAKWGK